MRGTIRVVLGLLIVFGCAGGFDNATDSQLLPLILITGLGLALMASGTAAMKGIK